MPLLAQFGNNFGETMIPLVAIVLIFGTPLIALLLHHQRKMAETFRGNAGTQAEVEALRHQVHVLTDRLNQQSIEMDGYRQQLMQRPTESENIRP